MSTFWSERRTTNKDRQVKKHYTQMSMYERKKCVELLQDTITENRIINFTRHSAKKVKGKPTTNIPKLIGFIFKNKFAYENIIEYNNTDYNGNIERRIVVKHPKVITVEGKPSYQFLTISLEDARVITVWYNSVDDTHRTLDLNYYSKDLTIQ
ncbi:hypothetical protein BT3_104 [Staphylococcus phage BT3]|nr:hypothetical protein BT3_104 [Staphylococcus phage BT3]